MGVKALATGKAAASITPHHKGMICGAAMSLSLIGDAVLAHLHLKGQEK